MNVNFFSVELEDFSTQIIEHCNNLYKNSSYDDLSPLSNSFIINFASAIGLNHTTSGEIHPDWNLQSISYLNECKSVGVFSFRVRCLVAAIEELMIPPLEIGDRYSIMQKVSSASLHSIEAAARHTAHKISQSILHSELIPELRNKKALASDFRTKGQLASTVTIAYIDMDGLKRLNDSLNHDAGDTALRCLGRALQRCCQEHQTAYHFSGDEFGLLSIDQEIPLLIIQLNELCAAAENKFSFGLATGSKDENLQTLVNEADQNMQIQKRQRRELGLAPTRSDCD